MSKHSLIDKNGEVGELTHKNFFKHAKTIDRLRGDMQEKLRAIGTRGPQRAPTKELVIGRRRCAPSSSSSSRRPGAPQAGQKKPGDHQRDGQKKLPRWRVARQGQLYGRGGDRTQCLEGDHAAGVDLGQGP